MARGIPVHTVGTVLDGIGHPRGAQRQHVVLSGIDVVDLDIEVELLGATRIGKLRRLVLWGQLERQPSSRRAR